MDQRVLACNILKTITPSNRMDVTSTQDTSLSTHGVNAFVVSGSERPINQTYTGIWFPADSFKVPFVPYLRISPSLRTDPFCLAFRFVGGLS
jgi:hypothetical protein